MIIHNKMKHFNFFFFFLCVFTSISVHCQTIISTFAGNGQAGFVNGSLEQAQFSSPFGMCQDKEGNLYIADAENHCIRKITPEGEVSTYAGNSIAGYQDGTVEMAQFNQPINVCMDDMGNLYVSDFLNHCIRKVSVEGLVSTVAGSGQDGFADGASDVAQFNYPRGIVLDASNNLYVADSWNHRIRKIDAATHEVSTYAGGGTDIGVGSAGSLKEGKADVARFYTPSGLSIDLEGNLYVADPFNHRIRKIDANQNVSTLAGGGLIGPNRGSFLDGIPTSGRLNTPTDVCWTSSGKVLIGDTFNNRVRLVDMSANSLTTLAGTGIAGYLDGADSIAQLNYPRGIVANADADSILVVDFNNHSIRQILLPSVATNIEENLVEEKPTIDFHLFPNPANNHINIRLDDSIEGIVFSAKILNNQQQMVYQEELMEGKEWKIKIAHLPSGVYFFVLEGGDSIDQHKFVVE